MNNSQLMHVEFYMMTFRRVYPLFIANICQIKPVTSGTLKEEYLSQRTIVIILP